MSKSKRNYIWLIFKMKSFSLKEDKDFVKTNYIIKSKWYKKKVFL